MKEEYRQWRSPNLDRSFDMLVFGEEGMPLVLFPTSQGRYFQAKDEGLIEAIRWFIETGKVKVYCPDSLDDLSWYNTAVPPAERALNQACYDRLVLDEIVRPAQQETGVERVAVGGCSFGGYHAVNFAFRHPELVGYVYSLSGIFDITRFTEGFYDDTIYFNNPADFIVQNNDPHLWTMGIVLGTGEFDVSLEESRQLSAKLDQKKVAHWLDVRAGKRHDWPMWKEMLPQYLSLLLPSF